VIAGEADATDEHTRAPTAEAALVAELATASRHARAAAVRTTVPGPVTYAPAQGGQSQ